MSDLRINTVIGIDPGAQGGIAVYIVGEKTKTIKMPKDIAELGDFFAYYAENYRPLVFLEKLSIRPDDVTASGDRAAMGKLYRIQRMMANYEHIRALLEASGIPYIMVHPLSWQTKLKLRLQGSQEEKAARKRRFRDAAAAFYPGVNVTLWNADALLIMHFGRTMLANEMKWILANLPQREQNKLF